MNLEREILFHINETQYKVCTAELTTNITLNTYLRSKLHLTGTKRMCSEGGCGVCIVVVRRKNRITNTTTIQAVNSCLVPLFACNGWHIETIEGLADGRGNNFHFLEKVLAHFNGTQCGFCSPGMVMNMYGLYRMGKTTMREIENSFGGNICRCTGYRSILSAFKSVCVDATPELKEKCADIEDLKICPRNYNGCINNCNNKSETAYYYNLGNTTWIKVLLLTDLLQVLRTFQNFPYKLIAGNTSIGVYKENIQHKVYVEISDVKELSSWKIENNCLEIGASLTLTETMQLFDDLAKNHEEFQYLAKLSKHIDLIANVPVRNIGTLAGNLMIKQQHPEFPSDIFLIFETAGAVLQITDVDGNRTKLLVRDLLKHSMRSRIIEKIVLPKRSHDFKYESFKIMPRAQNAHALVNAGFLLEINKRNIVKSAKVVYGNINPEFIHAFKTERFLIGKELFETQTLRQCFEILVSELNPDYILPDATPTFRKQLAISLFYKYILSIAPKDTIPSRSKSGGYRLERPLSSGVQEFETTESSYPVTLAIPKVESLSQTSGRAEYIPDMPDRPNQLFGALVLAKTRPLSIIKKIDATEALALNGVVAFFDKNDIPGQNNFTPKEANLAVKEEIFCSGEVQFFNQPLGLIIATNQELAEEAAALVKVLYEDGKNQPLFTINDILKAQEIDRIKLVTEIEPKHRGVNVDQVVKGSFELSWQYHFHMETQCCNIIPTEDGIDVYPSSQWMDLTQTAVATTLNIPSNKVNIFVRRLGGAFGAKIVRNSLITCAAAVAAYHLKKPVKMWLPFETNMNVIGKRYPMLCNYKVGVNKEGIIQYLESTFYCDYGKGGNEPNIPYVLETLTSTYTVDSWHIKAHSVNSDNHPSCYIRAPGSCEGLAMIEAIMEHVAISIDMDPLNFKLKNIDHKNDKLLQFVADLKKWADIDTRKYEITKFNQENRWKKRGLAVVPMTYPFTLFGNYGVIVSIYQSDGTVSIAHGGVEMGQGINTKAVQTCAFKLGIPIERVSVKPSNNLIAPNAQMTGGSLTSEGVCFGIIKACDVLLARMEPIKAKLENPTWEELVKKCHSEFVNLSASSMSSPKEQALDNYSVYGVCASEVEVDILTGEHVIRRVDLLEDTGESISPNIDIGQVEGAFVMGIGFFTCEQIVFNHDGELLTNRTWNYKPPGIKDIPVDFRVKFPKNNPNHVGVLKSKATAEPPLCLSCSVPLAIRNAVASARMEQEGDKEKWYPFCGPSTVENTYLNCRNDFKNYTLC